MAQVLLLKIDSDGFPREHSSSADDVTFLSFSVTGGGPVLSGSGLDMNNLDIVDVQDLAFVDPATATINQTAGSLVVDNIMAKERENTLTTAGGIAFPVITDVAGEVDALRIPALAGAPTASPTNGGEGHLVWDSAGNRLFAWDGSAWDDLSVSDAAESVQNIFTAGATIAARDVVYVSAADEVSPAIGTDAAQAQATVGFAVAGASATNPVEIRSSGIVSGFSGLTAGATYYLSTATAGAVQNAVPTGTGNVVLKVGTAKSATQMFINMQYLGRRA